MKNNVYHLDQKKYESKKSIIKYLLYFICAILLMIGGYFLLHNSRPAIIQARYGKIIDGFQSEALVVRDEKVILAPTSGQVKLKQKEGERINNGEPVITINNAHTITLYNKISGIVSYSIDGLESQLTPIKIHNINIEEFDQIKRDYSRLITGNHVQKGQSLYRIVNNFKLYLIIKTSAREAKRYYGNEVVFVQAQKINSGLIEGRIIDIMISNNQALLKIELNRFVEQWLNIRRVEIELIKNIYRGIVIPRQAVFTQPQGQGILTLKSNREYEFKNIKIENGNVNKVVVKGLEIGDNVLLNPEQVNYGEGGNN